MVQFHALGEVAVTVDGGEVGLGGSRQRRLVAMLLVHANTVVSVDRLADAVFAGDPTPAAATTLRSYVARLRRVIGNGDGGSSVVTRAPGYVLHVPHDRFDVSRFEACLAESRSLRSRDDPAGAAAALREGLALWRGDAYAEFADEDWVRPEAQRLEELRLVAQELLFEAELACGRAAQVIPELEAATEQSPLREALVGQLVLALYRTGRQADALRAYQRHREVLVEELGLDPSPQLQRLEEQVLAHDPELVAPAGPGEALRGYRLGDRLGTGEDGTVRAAHLPGVERDLVIRSFRADLADDPDFVRSFEATAQQLATLRHPAIVPIHDYWREPGAAHVVMRRMPGGSLADRIERIGRRPITTAEVAAMVRRVGAALGAAHAAGIVHGRLGPRSVLFDDAGDAWLSDFDLTGSTAGRGPEADVRALAALVQQCLPGVGSTLAAVLARVGDPSGVEDLDAFLPEVLEALTGEDGGDTGPAPNPYKGLRAFDEVDAVDFFGRDDLIVEMVRRLHGSDRRARLLLVIGGSGTGKSSVVRAGLLPRIRQGAVPGSEAWFVTTMLPGATPFKELAAALRRVAVSEAGDPARALLGDGGIDAAVRELLPERGELLLVIDQLEELFTSAPEAEQRRFLDGLAHAVSAPDSRLRVVGTLRADFFDRPLAHPGFGAVIGDATVTVPAMAASDLEAAIVEPARRAGRTVEGPLVAELVAAALDEPAGLPALQFTLFELAERAEGDLGLAAYRELGCLNGAIASRAEALYQSLDDEDQAAIRRLFAHLVVVSSEAEPTRRRAVRTDLTTGDPRLDSLIDRWTEARLLSVDRHPQTRLPTVEPAHEALLRAWPRLRDWIDEDRESLLLLERLREATATWVELHQDPSALYRGARLEVTLEAAGSVPLPAQERAFLDASREERDAESRRAELEARRRARANRRLRAQLVVIGVALVVALIGGFVAVDQRSEAVEERRVAFARELAAAADASIEEDPERSLLLALEAVERTRDGDAALPEAVGALHRAISRSRVVLTVPGLGGNLDWSPDGSMFVTEGPEDTGIVDVRDATTGESLRSWPGDEIDINEVAFDPTGRVLATGGDDGHLRLWDPRSGEALAEIGGEGFQVWGPSFSPDGRLVAAGWVDWGGGGQVQVVEVGTGRVVTRREAARVAGTDFSPDGSRLVIASIEDLGLVVIDPMTGDEVLRFGEEHGTSREARFSPDGRWIASGHQDGVVRVWEAATGRLRFSIAAHQSEANAVDWSADSSRLATAGNDGTARVHEITEGGTRELAVVAGRDTANGLGSVAFSPDADRIMTGDWAIASVKVWDVSDGAGAEWLKARSKVFRLAEHSFLSDGRTVVVIDPERGVVGWDVERGEQTVRLALSVPADEVHAIAPSPDGDLVAVHAGDGVVLHELASGRVVAELPSLGTWVLDMAWSADGQHFAYAQFDDPGGMTTVVDRQGDELGRLVEEDGYVVRQIAFTPDGAHLATARAVPRQAPGEVGVRVWDWRERQVALDVAELAIDVATSPDGRRVAFARELTGDVEVWDLGSGERVQVLRGAGVAYGLTWSADGRRIAVAGADGTVRVFDTEDGQLEVVLRGHERAVNAAAFSPDGSRLVSIDEGEEVRVWTLDLDELIEIAEGRLTRGLDDLECRRYLHQESCSER
jgi:WD40 repeat protein/DNA-binding SARP family transcriptional activator